MAGQAVSSVMQLSTFTNVKSIPREQHYTDFPVTVRVKAPETVPQHAPVDVVAAIDVSGSMSEEPRLELVKKAMEKVIQNLTGDKNRLAIVAFDDKIKEVTKLLPVTGKDKDKLSATITSLKTHFYTKFSVGLKRAIEILNDRKEAEKQDRLAFIIFLSDGEDKSFNMDDHKTTYQIHAFGYSKNHDPEKLKDMAKSTGGSYTAITQDLMKVTEKLGELSGRLSSIIAEDVHINLKSIHAGVYLSKVVPSTSTNKDYDDKDAAASESHDSVSIMVTDKRSGEIPVRAISSGEEREFTVYLDVPQGRGNGVDGSMELLMVGGVYKQSWDQKQVALPDSVVTVARPVSCIDSCKELDWIEERLKYWCKVKQDLSTLYDKAEGEAEAKIIECQCQCQCQVTKALWEASLEDINNAMYHDIYIAVLHALKLRQCRSGSEATAATENAPSSAA